MQSSAPIPMPLPRNPSNFVGSPSFSFSGFPPSPVDASIFEQGSQKQTEETSPREELRELRARVDKLAQELVLLREDNARNLVQIGRGFENMGKMFEDLHATILRKQFEEKRQQERALIPISSEALPPNHVEVIPPTLTMHVDRAERGYIWGAIVYLKNLVMNTEHSWKSHKYRVYLQQLQRGYQQRKFDRIKKALAASPDGGDKSCKEIVELFGARTFGSPRSSYHSMIISLREGLEKTAEDGPERHFLKRFIRMMFTKVELFGLAEDLVQNMVLLGSNLEQSYRVMEGANFGEFLGRCCEALDRIGSQFGTPHTHRLTNNAKASTIAFNPIGNNNFPFHLYSLKYRDREGASYVRECIRVPAPVLVTTATATVDPLYEAFILSCAGNRKRGAESIAYYNHQYPIPRRMIQGGNEEPKIAAIRAIEEKYSHFFHFCFPMDGAFFNQSGYEEKENMEYFEVFTKRYLETLLSEGEGYHFPKIIRESREFASEVNEIVTTVGATYFQGGDKFNLSKAQRQTFMLLTHFHLKQYYNAKYQICYYHSSCKDSIDRAAVQNCLEMYLVAMFLNREEDADLLKKIMTLTLFPALAVKKQGIIPHRRELIVNAINHLHRYKIGIKRQLTRLPFPFKNDFLLVGIDIKQPIQEMIPRPSDAVDESEYNAFLKKYISKHEVTFPQGLEKQVQEKNEKVDLLALQSAFTSSLQLSFSFSQEGYEKGEGEVKSFVELEKRLGEIDFPESMMHLLTNRIFSEATHHLQAIFNNPDAKIELRELLTSRNSYLIIAEGRGKFLLKAKKIMLLHNLNQNKNFRVIDIEVRRKISIVGEQGQLSLEPAECSWNFSEVSGLLQPLSPGSSDSES